MQGKEDTFGKGIVIVLLPNILAYRGKSRSTKRENSMVYLTEHSLPFEP